MEARYVAAEDLTALLDAESRVWRGRRDETLAMMGTPSGMQPTAAVRAAWPDAKIGSVRRVAVAAVHDARHLAFRLEWEDASEDRAIDDPTAFPDAAAVLLPAAKGAPLLTMGAPRLPVNAWYWRADEDGTGRQVVSEGLGTTRTTDRELLRSRGTWKDGRWRVVLARAFRVETAATVAQLEPGQSTSFGVAVWDGGRGERAGIKSFSGPTWHPLRLAAVPRARR